MVVLSSQQVVQLAKTGGDPNSVTSVAITYKALSDVSCLGEFKNIQRLDLSFNSLTSLEGLRSCVNLKWLSVANNKLRSLEGIEGLVKLTVLNAGKNKLNSMDGLHSLMSLRALILNDNKISSICKLDHMTELNTLVLSRNPIREIALSLAKRNSISKLSLSNCQLQLIGSSLKSCTELKELRLSHNQITTLPSELACNNKLQNLDLGNNVIPRWSDLEVLSSLVSLKNLNLCGNPIAEKEGLAKKIQKLLPNVSIFNAKPINKVLKGELGRPDTSHDVGIVQNVVPVDIPRKKSRKHNLPSENEGFQPVNAGNCEAKDLKPKKQKRSEMQEEASDAIKESKKKNKKRKENTEKTSDHVMHQLENRKNANNVTKAAFGTRETSEHKEPAFDDGETPFVNLLIDDTSGNSLSNGKPVAAKSVNESAEIVTITKEKKKNKKHTVGPTSLQLLAAGVDEVGLGGPSIWDE
ncbi:unnamed protein product [Cuscuta campestris]|uniref:Protein phosphatase 1 regulatory subunit 7 n=1 Tax=Cuscuta campestris TaxID=132261 RepID=A0A484MYN5_9ASTE|nr:unnamed protein product [Cuscuta campestris]